MAYVYLTGFPFLCPLSIPYVCECVCVCVCIPVHWNFKHILSPKGFRVQINWGRTIWWDLSGSCTWMQFRSKVPSHFCPHTGMPYHIPSSAQHFSHLKWLCLFTVYWQDKLYQRRDTTHSCIPNRARHVLTVRFYESVRKFVLVKRKRRKKTTVVGNYKFFLPKIIIKRKVSDSLLINSIRNIANLLKWIPLKLCSWKQPKWWMNG